jgi:hypothetical protein
MFKILAGILAAGAFVAGIILIFRGQRGLGATLFFLGIVGAGFLLPAGNHDTTGGASDC